MIRINIESDPPAYNQLHSAVDMNLPLLGASPLTGTAALVVACEEDDRVFLASTLTSAGLLVTTTDSFRSARGVLTEQPPSVLVTEIRLGAYNGLHLALLGRSMRPHMAVVAIAPRDRMLRRAAEAMGAAFVSEPVTNGELLAAVYRTALREHTAHEMMSAAAPHAESRSTEGRQMAAAELKEPRRGYRKRRRDIATFLLLAASRQ